MCTILTMPFALYDANKEAVKSRIRQDFARNSHGNALILGHKNKKKTVFFQSLDLEATIAMLDAFPWERMFLHLRYSTTTTQGLSGCHGFQTHTGWFVMHNGVLRGEDCDRLPVDSMAIAECLKYQPPDSVVSWLVGHESFANVFLIKPEAGEFYVSRSSAGTLHWNEDATCWSSNAIPGVCEIPFPNGRYFKGSWEIEKPPVHVWPSYYPGYDRFREWPEAGAKGSWPEAGAKGTKRTSPTLETKTESFMGMTTDADTEPLEAEDIDLKNVDFGKLTKDELVDVYWEADWITTGVPLRVQGVLTRGMRKFLLGYHRANVKESKRLISLGQ